MLEVHNTEDDFTKRGHEGILLRLSDCLYHQQAGNTASPDELNSLQFLRRRRLALLLFLPEGLSHRVLLLGLGYDGQLAVLRLPQARLKLSEMSGLS